MFAQPAKKMVFMGGEIGQYREWAHEGELDWNLLDYPLHRGVQSWMRDLNAAYSAEPALHQLDVRPEGFEWVDCNDNEASVISLLRWSKQSARPAENQPIAAETSSNTDAAEVVEADDRQVVLVVLNHTPVPRPGYRIGVPRGGFWKEILNSDAKEYGGGGMGNYGGVEADEIEHHGRPYSLKLTLPPLAALFFKWQPNEAKVGESAGADWV